MQEFFGNIFPLITFDVVPTDYIYAVLNAGIDDEALTEQFDHVGYGSQLVFDNLGSLLLFIVA
jgi:hypothetical protein